MGRSSPTFPDNPQAILGVGGKPRAVVTYSLSLASLLLALPISKLLDNFGPLGIYMPLLFVVVLCAWYGGVGPALLCQLCGALIAFGFLARPVATGPATRTQLYDLLGFVVVGELGLFFAAYIRGTGDLRTNANNLQLIATASNDVLWRWDISSDRISLTGNLNAIFGHSGRAIEKRSAWWRELIHREDSEAAWDDLNGLLNSATNTWAREYRIRKSDGSHLLVATRGTVVRNRAGKALQMIGGLSDITAIHEAQDRLAFEALYDAVTGLPSRQYFRDRLQQTISTLPEDWSRSAVLFLDLDRFKTVNDSLGHAIGDKLLRAVSKRIELCLRTGEMAARFGGDEFTVLVGRVANAGDAIQVAERLQRCLAAPFELEGHTVVITASIGIALGKKGTQAEDILRHADVAMYRAKAQGRARCEVFASDLDAARMNLVQLESEIRKGIAEGEFLLYYQPIVDLRTGRLSGVEALVRWRHPRRGLLPPVEFVPIAEESGLIRQLGNWVIWTACAQLNAWRIAFPPADRLYVNVNIAEKQFMDPELPALLQSCLRRNNLDGTNLVLELTENAILGDTADAARRMYALGETGVRFALDDFGKGHSSLARLHALPIAILKVDCAFIQAIAEGRPALTDAIVALGHELNLTVTAECVETREQVRHLCALNCNTAQGNFFAPPTDPASFLDLMRSRTHWLLDSGHASGT